MKKLWALYVILLLCGLMTACNAANSATGSSGAASASDTTLTSTPEMTSTSDSASATSSTDSNTQKKTENKAEKKESKIAWSSDTYPIEVHDFFGHVTKLESMPDRVAVLSGTLLNIWYDLGGKSVCSSNISDNIRLVEEYREEMLALPKVGPVYSIDMEAVVGNTPQLIITQAGVQSKSTEALRNMNYPVVAALVKTYDDLCNHYRLFGALLGVSEKAEEKIVSFESKRKEIISKLPSGGKRVVILYLTSGALSVKLDGSIAGDMAKTLGVENIASDLPPDTIGSENTPLDIEYIVAQNPDLVLVTSMIGSNEIAVETMQKHFSQNQAWQTVEAVREGRVYYLPQEYFLYHSGPYYNDALELLAKTIYPEIYGEIQK